MSAYWCARANVTDPVTYKKYTDRVPDEACFKVRPELLPSDPDHLVRCHIPSSERKAIAQSVLSETVSQAPIAAVGGGAPLAGVVPSGTSGASGSGAASSPETASQIGGTPA